MLKQASALSDSELSAKIDRYVSLRPVKNELDTLRKQIGDELESRGIETFTTKTGATAAVLRKPAYKWVLEKLLEVLPRKLVDQFCPRVPDTKLLNQRAAACPDDKKLAGCRVEVPGRKTIQILGPGESAGDED